MAFDDLLFGWGALDSCFPGELCGETELECPYCHALVTVAVADSCATQFISCSACGATFQYDGTL